MPLHFMPECCLGLAVHRSTMFHLLNRIEHCIFICVYLHFPSYNWYKTIDKTAEDVWAKELPWGKPTQSSSFMWSMTIHWRDFPSMAMPLVSPFFSDATLVQVQLWWQGQTFSSHLWNLDLWQIIMNSSGVNWSWENPNKHQWAAYLRV